VAPDAQDDGVIKQGQQANRGGLLAEIELVTARAVDLDKPKAARAMPIFSAAMVTLILIVSSLPAPTAIVIILSWLVVGRVGGPPDPDDLGGRCGQDTIRRFRAVSGESPGLPMQASSPVSK
jgi:hypothetical protein